MLLHAFENAVRNDGVGLFRSVALDDVVTHAAKQGQYAGKQAHGFMVGELHEKQIVLGAFGELHRGKPLDGGRLRPEKADVPQVVRAGFGVRGGCGTVKAGRNLFVAARFDELRKGGVHLIGLGVEPVPACGKRLDPAVGRGVRAGVSDDDRRFRKRGIIGRRDIGDLGFAERERRPAHVGMRPAPEDFDEVGHKKDSFHPVVADGRKGVFERALGKRVPGGKRTSRINRF